MNNEDLIIGYFKNTLTADQRKRVEDLVRENQEFKNEFEGYKSLRNAFSLREATSLKEELKALESKSKPIQKKPNTRQFIRYAVAAVVISILGISIFFNVNTQSIYADYYESYPNVYEPVVRGEGDSESSKAFLYYENKEYEKAQQEFEILLNKEYNPNVAFYLGLSYLETQNYNKALRLFENVKGEAFEFKEELLWYSALAYIKIESYQKARKQLSILAKQSSSTYGKKALDVLSDLPNE